MSSSAIATLPAPIATALARLQALYRAHGAQLPPVVALLLALIIATQCAALLWRLVPLPESARWQPAPAFVDTSPVRARGNGEAVANARLFGEYQVAASASAQTLAAAPETTLNFTLLGILAGTRDAESMALIAKDNGQEAPYRIGDDVAPGVNLQAIFLDRVILSRNGTLETLRLDKNSASNAQVISAIESNNQAATSGTPEAAVMLAQVRDQVLSDPSKAASFVRLQPITSDAGVRGYRVYPGAQREAFEAAGLQAGDVVTGINGTPLDNPGQALQLLQSLSTASTASLAVERNGQIQSITINLSP